MALLDPRTGARPQSYRDARDVGKLVERPGALLGAAPLLLAIFLAAGAAASLAWQTAVHSLAFDGDFSDGPFQLYNALRRIAGGQIYGRDFQAFTGIGTNWAHLPIYLLAGADFRASEISRFLTSGLCHGAAAVALARAFGQAFPTRRDALLFGLLFFAAGAAVYWRTFQPGASLLGVRTFFPLLLAAALAAPRPAPWMALALAASLLSSVDHAVAALVALAQRGRRDLHAEGHRRPEVARFCSARQPGSAFSRPSCLSRQGPTSQRRCDTPCSTFQQINSGTSARLPSSSCR